MLAIREINNKRMIITSTESNSFDLPTDLLQIVLSKLTSFQDIFRFQAVCSSWNKVAKSHIASPSLSLLPQTPWLMIPPNQRENSHSRNFFTFAEKKAYTFKNVFEGIDDAWCVGSSRGWLIIVDERANLFIFNPFLEGRRRRFKLPSITNSSLSTMPTLYIAKHLRKTFISKAVLLFDQSQSKEFSFYVVIIYSFARKIAYCNHMEEKNWNNLHPTNENQSTYCDIVSHNGKLITLSSAYTIEVFEFHKHSNSPMRIAKLVPTSPLVFNARTEKYLKDMYFRQTYLVESEDKRFVVSRFVGYFVNGDNEPVEEADLLPDDDTQPLVCPYRTLEFVVHEFDLTTNKLKKIESLEGRALFVGGSESMLISTLDFPEYEQNSIYFTDDNWIGMEGDFMYGGHDNGVYSLGTNVVKSCYEFDDERIDPPPFWIVPSPW
ncbi:hypothetical protein UlMin_010168 [Ulmus minor]